MTLFPRVFLAVALLSVAVLAQSSPQNESEKLSDYLKAAEQGDADAQYSLAFSYLEGYGVTQDYVEAARWFRKAAEQGNADAQSKLSYHCCPAKISEQPTSLMRAKGYGHWSIFRFEIREGEKWL